MYLYNRDNREVLKKRLMEEPFKRTTLSFYRYIRFDDPENIRDLLFREWFELNCFGRIYIAKEGINAQMSVPDHHLSEFLKKLQQHLELEDIPVKYGIEDNGKSFYKLIIKVRPKIVADGLDDDAFDVTNTGTHLTVAEFHELVDHPEVLVVDMRNHYESEVGHFKGAVCPPADTFREEIEMVAEQFKDQKERRILLYCTGGIRCEKASAFLKHCGFKDVNQLHGGIIEYTRQIKRLGLKSKFIGKNFVFDERMGESINGEVIACCHQCGKKCDTHVNCANDLCHILFIQCPECAAKYSGCCSSECQSIFHMPVSERQLLAQTFRRRFGNRKAFRKDQAGNPGETSLKLSTK
ncbi:MAG: rhodanese-related sulfurtransferase [Mangrovibacterium sp.]